MDRLRNPDEGPFVACGDRHLLPSALPLSPAPGASGPAPRRTPALKATLSSTWAGCLPVRSRVRQPGPARLGPLPVGSAHERAARVPTRPSRRERTFVPSKLFLRGLVASLAGGPRAVRDRSGCAGGVHAACARRRNYPDGTEVGRASSAERRSGESCASGGSGGSRGSRRAERRRRRARAATRARAHWRLSRSSWNLRWRSPA